MLGVLVGRDDPRHLRQRAGRAGADELRQHGVDLGRAERHAGVGLPGLDRALDGELLAGRRGGVHRGLVLLVEPERVVAVVADPAVVAAAVADLVVGVHLPGDPGRRQLLRVRRDPGELDRVVRRVGRPAVRRPGPEVHPVGARRAEDRLVVPVADGERVRQRVVERQVGAGEVAHALLGLGRHPVVPQAAVAGAVVAGPAVVEVARVLRVHLGGVHVERQQVAEVGPGLVRLVEYRGAALVLQRLLVGEAADALQGAEVMVEGSVLLHEDHHVLKVGDGARRGACPARAGNLDGARADGGGPGERAARLEEAASADAARRGILVSAHAMIRNAQASTRADPRGRARKITNEIPEPVSRPRRRARPRRRPAGRPAPGPARARLGPCEWRRGT